MRLRAIWWRVAALGLAAAVFHVMSLAGTGIVAIAAFSDGLYTRFDLFRLSLFNAFVYVSLGVCVCFLFIAVFAHKRFARRLLLLLTVLYALMTVALFAVDSNVLGIDHTEYIPKPE